MYINIRKRNVKERLAIISKARTLTVDSAEGLFRRSDHDLALFSIKPATAQIIPLDRNPNRITLFREPQRLGLQVFYYANDQNHFLIAQGGQYVRIHREMIPIIRKAIRKFTRQPFIPPKPKPTGVDYPPPPERAN